MKYFSMADNIKQGNRKLLAARILFDHVTLFKKENSNSWNLRFVSDQVMTCWLCVFVLLILPRFVLFLEFHVEGQNL